MAVTTVYGAHKPPGPKMPATLVNAITCGARKPPRPNVCEASSHQTSVMSAGGDVIGLLIGLVLTDANKIKCRKKIN